MSKRVIEYKDIMLLGFSRADDGDSVFRDQYGYDWFIVTKRLWENKKQYIEADWDCTTRTVTVCRYSQRGGRRESEIKIESLAELKTIIKGYGLF